MKRSLLVIFLCPAAFSSGALAAELSITGRIDQIFDGSNNYFLSASPSGYTVRSLSAANLNFLAATPTDQYRLDTNYSYYKYLGPGAQDAGLTWGTPMDAKASYQHNEQLSRYDSSVLWQRADVLTRAFAQTGNAVGRGTFDTYRADVGVTHQITRLDKISLSSSATAVSYSDPDQTPYTDFRITPTWHHRLSSTTTLINTVNFDWFIADNPANSQRLFWNPTTGLQSELSPRLTFNGAVGPVFINAWQKGVVPVASGATQQPGGITPFQGQAGTAKGWMGNFLLNYKLLPTVQVALNGAHSVVPIVTGQLQTVDSIGSTLRYDINHSSSLSFLAQYSQVTPARTATTNPTRSDFFTASVSYDYSLGREWRMSLSYAYRQRSNNAGLVTSSSITSNTITSTSNAITSSTVLIRLTL